MKFFSAKKKTATTVETVVGHSRICLFWIQKFRKIKFEDFRQEMAGAFITKIYGFPSVHYRTTGTRHRRNLCTQRPVKTQTGIFHAQSGEMPWVPNDIRLAVKKLYQRHGNRRQIGDHHENQENNPDIKDIHLADFPDIRLGN